MSVAPPPQSVVVSAMEHALAQARQADRAGEVPVGAAVLAPDGGLLAQAHNLTEARRDPCAHAELEALRGACERLGRPRLPEGSLLAVTLEPCAMCAGAIVLARPTYLVFGTPDPKAGACGSVRDIVRDPRLNHRVRLLPPVLGDECGRLLRAFFRARRKPGKGGERDLDPSL